MLYIIVAFTFIMLLMSVSNDAFSSSEADFYWGRGETIDESGGI